MKNKKLIRFVESFILLPIMAVSTPLGGLSQHNVDLSKVPQIVLSQKQNIEANGLLAFNQVMDQKAKILKDKAEAIDTYFTSRGMPLAGYGMKMVQEAEKNELDWRLIAAIAVRESTGGKFACIKVKHNAFGWGSCKIGFNSNEEAIETVARNLGGNNPNTEKHYANKNTREILRAYNPPSIVPKYVDQVISIMDDIDQNIKITDNA